jgi:hypothetical protein
MRGEKCSYWEKGSTHHRQEKHTSDSKSSLAKLGASNNIYSNQTYRKKIVRGVRNRFDKQISS